MDAPEEDLDIKLQKISGDLIADLDKSLRPFLRTPKQQQQQQHDGKKTVRSRVRTRETERLISTVHLPPSLPLSPSTTIGKIDSNKTKSFSTPSKNSPNSSTPTYPYGSPPSATPTSTTPGTTLLLLAMVPTVPMAMVGC